MLRVTILNRLNSLCASAPFSLTQAISPFDFTHQPATNIDQVFRVDIDAKSQQVIGGFSYSEERTEMFDVWVARLQNADPQDVYRRLVTDVTSLAAAITVDGATGGGDYAVMDGGGVSCQHDKGQDYAVARLQLPINYETTIGEGVSMPTGASLIHQVSVTLTNADVLGWPQLVDGFPIIPTPGRLTRSIRPVKGQLWTNDSVGDHPYAGMQGTDQIDFAWGNGDVGLTAATNAIEETELGNVTNLLQFGPYIGEVLAPFYEYLVHIADQENLPLVLRYAQNTTTLTGGDPANALNVLVEFRVFDRSLKRFLTTVESGWNEDTRTFH